MKAARGRLRIIAGAWRGRMIETPPDQAVRPTAERAREALFNRLAHSFEGIALQGARVIDVYAGSGALGLEALSRGAAHASFVEIAPAATKLIRANIGTLGAEDRSTVLMGDARSLPRASAPCDIAFLDPPYGQDLAAPALASLAQQGWLRPEAVVSVETEADEVLPLPERYRMEERRAYGRAALTFFRFNG
jgi:16S rRNA (guanine966-N2)-methyltransferase